MSSPVVFSLTKAQLDYLAAILTQPACWPTFHRRIAGSLEKAGLVRFEPVGANGRVARLYGLRERPRLTRAGVAAARLAKLIRKASRAGASARGAGKG